MTRKTTRRKISVDAHTDLTLVVNRLDIDAEMSVNSTVRDPQLAWTYSDEDPVFQSITYVNISGICTAPMERAGDLYNLTLYGDDAPSRAITAKLKDAQVRDKHDAPQYRMYRGRHIPVYDPPKGLALLDKVSGKSEWSAWVNVSPRLLTDLLILAGHGRQLYARIHELKLERKRWIQSISVKTTDPELE